MSRSSCSTRSSKFTSPPHSPIVDERNVRYSTVWDEFRDFPTRLASLSQPAFFTNRPARPDEKEVGSMVERTQTRPSTGPPSGSDGDLVTERGRTAIADSVVSKIAGIAAREISGVHNMGTGAARAVG